VLPDGLRVVVRGVHDDRVLQSEPVLQPGRQLDVDLALMADLDAHQPAVACGVEQPGDLEPAQPELVGDLDLRTAVEVIAAGDGGREHDLGGPGELVCHHPSCSSEHLFDHYGTES
jgi:hypothetical protein